MEPPPTFFYNPNAYQLGIIEEKAIVCQCCQRPRAFRYTGNLYCRAAVRDLCPWCIADGRAAAKYEGSFVADFEGVNPDPTEPSVYLSEASVAQVSSHTPGYASWQGEVWLGHCGEACIFLGYPDAAALAPIWEQVLPDILANNWDAEDLRQHLRKDGDITGYLFQCQHCGQHRLHLDAS